MAKAQVALVLLIVGCGPRFVPARPVTIAAAPGVFDKAIGVLVAEGDSIETKDAAAGTIATRWVHHEQLGGTVQLRITITVAGATLIVASQCQRETVPGPLTTKTGLEPCGDRQPEAQQAKVDRIAAALR
jgi:hypothetical protein